MDVDAFAPALTMLRALREREVSAVELLDLHLRRIERYNPALNAVVTLDADRARSAAAAADTARARGEDGALLGLPLTIKDCIYVEGMPTTGGLAERAGAIAEADARVIARLRAAGAVFMGKTNVPPYAADWQSSNPLFGRTNNPWDLTRTPGGSTGGGAAALAAGLTPLEFGGDFGGSIRIPAAFCGVYGHKSSETALPRSGHFPAPNTPNSATGLAVLGPLARSAEDLDLVLGLVCGPDAGEDSAWRLELPPPRHEALHDYRVAVLPPLPWLPVDDEIQAALDGLAGRLSGLGVRVETLAPDGLADLRDYYKRYRSALVAISGSGASQEQNRQLAAQLRATGDEFAAAAAAGLEAGVGDYLEWFGWRERYRAAFRAFFRDRDVLLAPCNITNAFPHTDAPRGERFLTLNGLQVSYDHQFFYPGLCNFSGQPGTAFPAGRSRAGLPIGLQAIGPYLEDRTPIRFAALLGREFGGFQMPAGYVGQV
jgi:amidase